MSIPIRFAYGMAALLALAGCGDKGSPQDEEAVARGKDSVRDCMSCHSLNDHENKVGPTLKDVVGRKAGSVADFEYSDAMRASGIVWTEDKIVEFLRGPSKVVPGTRMALSPLPEDRARDIAKYLSSLSR